MSKLNGLEFNQSDNCTRIIKCNTADGLRTIMNDLYYK